MRIAALLAVAALLALSVGGPLHATDPSCCAATMPHEANAHGASPCVGFCTSAVQSSRATVEISILWSVTTIASRHPIPFMAYPIEKPPA